MLRVLTLMLSLKPLSRSRSVAGAHIQAFTFIALASLARQNLHMLDSLVRVSRRVERDHVVRNERQELNNSDGASVQKLAV